MNIIYRITTFLVLILISFCAEAQENRAFEKKINQNLKGRFQFYEFSGDDTIEISNAKILASEAFGIEDSIAGDAGLLGTMHTVAIDENDYIGSVLFSNTSAVEMLFISREPNKGVLQAFEFFKGKRHALNNFTIEWHVVYTEGNPILSFNTTEEYYGFLQNVNMIITDITNDYIELQHSELCVTYRYQKIK